MVHRKFFLFVLYILLRIWKPFAFNIQMSQRSVIPLSTCETGPFFLSSGRIKAVSCEFILVRLLNLYSNEPSNEQPTTVPFPITIHYPPAVYKHSDLPRQGLAAIPCRFHQRSFHKRCNSCSMACATLILLLVKYEPVWKTGWGFPEGAKAPPGKVVRRTCPIRGGQRGVFTKALPTEGGP